MHSCLMRSLHAHFPLLVSIWAQGKEFLFLACTHKLSFSYVCSITTTSLGNSLNHHRSSQNLCKQCRMINSCSLMEIKSSFIQWDWDCSAFTAPSCSIESSVAGHPWLMSYQWLVALSEGNRQVLLANYSTKCSGLCNPCMERRLSNVSKPAQWNRLKACLLCLSRNISSA